MQIRNFKLDNNEAEKKKFAENLGKSNTKRTTIDKEKVQIETSEQEPKQNAFYIPDFKPKSTVEYKNYNVDIYNFQIKTFAVGTGMDYVFYQSFYSGYHKRCVSNYSIWFMVHTDYLEH